MSYTILEYVWLDGYKTFASIPPMEEYALFHPKDIKRQEKQNKYCSTL